MKMCDQNNTDNASFKDFWETFSNDEFLKLYIKIWDKRLENSGMLDKQKQEMVAFAHFAIKNDIKDFFMQPITEAKALLEKEAA